MLSDLVTPHAIEEDEEEAGNANPIAGLVTKGVDSQTLQPRHYGATGDGHGEQ